MDIKNKILYYNLMSLGFFSIDGFFFSLGVIWKPFGNHAEEHDDD